MCLLILFSRQELGDHQERSRCHGEKVQEEDLETTTLLLLPQRLQGCLRSSAEPVCSQKSWVIGTQGTNDDILSPYSPNLTDGATPILVVGTDDIVDSLRMASLRHMAANPKYPSHLPLDNNNNAEKKL